MGVVITRDDIRAYAEVNYIINHMNEKYREKVPEKLKTFFNEYKDPTMEININPYVPLQNQGLQRYTLEIIALLHLKYWNNNKNKNSDYCRKNEIKSTITVFTIIFEHDNIISRVDEVVQLFNTYEWKKCLP